VNEGEGVGFEGTDESEGVGESADESEGEGEGADESEGEDEGVAAHQ